MSLIKFEVIYNTESGQYTTGVDTEGYSLVHSGSNYLRIYRDGQEPYPQIGTIGAHCPGTQYLSDKLGSCSDAAGDHHDHLSFSIARKLS